MDKADDDDSTPPHADGKARPDAASDATAEPAAPRAMPAVTKAPAPVRSIGGSHAPPWRLAPYAGVRAPGFAGCVFIRAVPGVLAGSRANWGLSDRQWSHRGIEYAMGDLLADGAMRAGGIHPEDGVAVWAPCETWPLTRSFQGQEEYALWRALMGERVRFPLASRSFECHPFVFFRDVALLFGAKTPPEDPPQRVLDRIQDWESGSRQALGIEAKAAPAAKKPPVAPAALLAKWREFVAQYPDANQRPDADAQRAAMAAAFPNNASPNEQTMRKLRAHPDTPPGWSKHGPRKQSG